MDAEVVAVDDDVDVDVGSVFTAILLAVPSDDDISVSAAAVLFDMTRMGFRWCY